MASLSTQTLNYEQVKRLDKVLRQHPVEIHGSGNFPTLNLQIYDLLIKLCTKLSDNHLVVKDVRLNGSAASCILARPSNFSYNDIDLIFTMEMDSEKTMLNLKDLVLETLISYLPPEVNKEKLTIATLTEAYVRKLTKVWQTKGDKWSLISLTNYAGMNLELKFVNTMKRKFQFSVDSFQIMLDSLLRFYTVSQEPMSVDFFPSIEAESVYGDFHSALDHLNMKKIATHSPEDIKGGGLLKYCDLLSHGYQHVLGISDIETMERLMCSRFFIDYPDIMQQYQKLNAYLCNHFVNRPEDMVPYLYKLHSVVRNSTVCLMGHERRQSLELIQSMCCQIQSEMESEIYSTQENDLLLLVDDNGNPLVVEEVYYHPWDLASCQHQSAVSPLHNTAIYTSLSQSAY